VTTPAPIRLYFDGPLRVFALEPFQGCVPYAGGDLKGYAGLFVCAQCRKEVPRVLFSMALGDWLCRDCETAAKRQRAGHLVGKGTT
jgi:hypothetical protein